MKNDLFGSTILTISTEDNGRGKELGICLEGEVMLTITTDMGELFFYHEQDCCESISLNDGLEELETMIGETIYNAYKTRIYIYPKKGTLQCQNTMIVIHV